MALFFYKAKNANVILIIYKQPNKSGNIWIQILWNLETNEFKSDGNFLHAQLDCNRSSISPCGKYFYHAYNRYHKDALTTNVAISKIPSFQPILYSSKEIGRWFDPLTWSNGFPVIYNQMKTDTFELKLEDDFIKENCVIKKEICSKYDSLFGSCQKTLDGYEIKNNLILKGNVVIFDASQFDI